MTVRQPFRAGSFYPAGADACRQQARRLLESADPPDSEASPLYGGLLPHAGWDYSGRLAARTLKTLHADRPLETVLLLGADHVGTTVMGEVFASGSWLTPLGEVPVDEEVAAVLLENCKDLRANPEAHRHEHSLEVQIPVLQVLAPEARIVPIVVPPAELAVHIGQQLGRALTGLQDDVRIVGSTDLTHIGGHFGSPGTHGDETEQWACRNDQRILERVTAMDGPGVIAEARQRGNACGAGAIAATIAACRELGASAGHVLEYTNSYRVTHQQMPGMADDTTVGYAAVVFA